MQNIPMELLRTFVTAIEVGSFTGAAKTVGRTQSAVSVQIRRLEELTRVQLFHRDAHKLVLTSEGVFMAQYAQRILALNDEALASLRQPSVSGTVRLGAPHEYTASLLPEFLGKFAQAHPNVVLEVTSDLTKNLLRRQQNGEFDLVVALHDGAKAKGGRKIFTEPLVWIGSTDHPCYRQTPLPLVLAPAPCIYRDHILQALNDVERACRIVYLSSSYNGISAAVRAGIGITGMTSSTKPPRCQVLPDDIGLPPLGQLEVRLHRAPGKPSVALSRLEDYIAGSFASTGTSKLAGATAD